jgi:hypothetical protein
LHNHQPFSAQSHAFVVRIWREPGLAGPDGSPLWRGQVQHAASGQALAFQSLDELLRFIQSWTSDPGNARVEMTDRKQKANEGRQCK